MDPIAELSDVYKRFGDTEALSGVDLSLHRGDVLAVLGPNGAGKTTAISLLLGQRKPDRGQARLMGMDPRNPASRRRIGATPQETGFPERLTVREVIELVQAHFPNPLSTGELLDRFGLVALAGRQTGGLSGGEKRRLAVALAFVGRPEAVFLDEPTTGLDVEARRGLWQNVRRYVADGGTVLLTTHYLEEAEALARRVVVINHGRVTARGSVAEIIDQVGLRKVRFKAPAVPDLPDVVKTERHNETVTLYTADSDALVRHLVARDVAFRDLEVEPTTLEEAFLVLTGGTA